MSDYYDIKKLCVLSRIEIEESKIHQTTEKIKEIISFFNKIDEFELKGLDDNNTIANLSQSMPTIATTTSNKEDEIDDFIKFEKNIDDLRNDENNDKLNFFKDNESNDKNKNNTSKFSFKFHHNKNGYVIGPRI